MSIREEINNILNKDPAANHWLEVLLCYPGFQAVTMHRLSHWLWKRKLLVLARLLSQLTRTLTGIEIHPGARLGRRVFIDHGMGVVIGETAEVGDDVVLYQGVTLGAGAAARGGAETRGQKRHPTLGNNVVVGSGAEIQGAISVGNNVQVASRSIVLKPVPDNSVVVGVPGRIIYRDGERIKDAVPDIEAEAIKSLKEHISSLEQQVSYLRKLVGMTDHDLKAAVGMDSKPEDDKGDSVAAPAVDPIDVFLHGAGI